MTPGDSKSRFFDFLLAANQPYLAAFEEWVFQRGMLFNSREKWWGDKGKRETAHEGLDLCQFRDAQGRVRNLGGNIRIPAAFSGMIVKIGRDFLGTSIYLSHEIFSPDQRQLYTIYGHTNPLTAVASGKQVAAGETLATVSVSLPRKTDILPHLHITCAWIPLACNPSRLTWQNLARDPAITLIDPLAILSPPAAGAEPAA